MSDSEQAPDKHNNSKKPTLRQLIGSVLSAGFGVQSDRNRERDFKHGNIKTYVVAGLLFTAVFVFIVITVVKLVLSQ